MYQKFRTLKLIPMRKEWSIQNVHILSKIYNLNVFASLIDSLKQQPHHCQEECSRRKFWNFCRKYFKKFLWKLLRNYLYTTMMMKEWNFSGFNLSSAYYTISCVLVQTLLEINFERSATLHFRHSQTQVKMTLFLLQLVVS